MPTIPACLQECIVKTARDTPKFKHLYDIVRSAQYAPGISGSRLLIHGAEALPQAQAIGDEWAGLQDPSSDRPMIRVVSRSTANSPHLSSHHHDEK